MAVFTNWEVHEPELFNTLYLLNSLALDSCL